eukprot:2534893-Amphidinium_carterae.2
MFRKQSSFQHSLRCTCLHVAQVQHGEAGRAEWPSGQGVHRMGEYPYLFTISKGARHRNVQKRHCRIRLACGQTIIDSMT